MNSKEIFAICFIIMLAVLIPVSIVLTQKKNSPPNNPYSSFSIVPDISAESSGNKSIAVKGLSDAIDKCLEQSCKSFTYSEAGKVMNIVSLTSRKFDKPGVNLLTLQTGIQN